MAPVSTPLGADQPTVLAGQNNSAGFMKILSTTAGPREIDLDQLQQRGVDRAIATELERGWTVTRSATNSGFDFTSENPAHTETRHVIVKVSLPHESGDTFCAFPDAEEQLIETDSAYFLYLVTAGASDHSEVVPFHRDRLREHYYARHFSFICRFRDEELQPATTNVAPRAAPGCWQIIEGAQ